MNIGHLGSASESTVRTTTPIEIFLSNQYTVPINCQFFVISCLSNYSTHFHWDGHWGDYFDFNPNSTMYLNYNIVGWFNKLKKFLSESNRHMFVVLPQKNQLPLYKNLTYIELSEFYGVYWDFFKNNTDKIEFTNQVEKHFLFLSKRVQRDRQFLFYNLVKESLHSGNYVSFLGEDGCGVIDYNLVEQNHRWIEQHFSTGILPVDVVKNMIPYRSYPEFLQVTDDYGTTGGWVNPSKLFQNSFVSIVAESYVDQPFDPIFTEKIFKPIWNFRPFIVSASTGALAYLKKLGFATFDQWVDESYDTETDLVKRVTKINQEINRLSKLPISECCKMLQDMREILTHNRQNFYNLKLQLDSRVEEVNNLIQQHIDTMKK